MLKGSNSNHVSSSRGGAFVDTSEPANDLNQELVTTAQCVSAYICWCLSAFLSVSQWRNSRSAFQKTFVWLCLNLGTCSFHCHFTAFCGFSDPVGWLYRFVWTHLCENKHKTHTRCTATGAIGWCSVTCFKLFLVWFCSVSPPHVETMLGSTKHPFGCYGLMRSRKLEGFDSSFWWLLEFFFVMNSRYFYFVMLVYYKWRTCCFTRLTFWSLIYHLEMV